jgi:hypothetical protein
MMVDDDECGAIGGMIGRGNQSARRIPAPLLLCPPQILHPLSLLGNSSENITTLTNFFFNFPIYLQSVMIHTLRNKQKNI